MDLPAVVKSTRWRSVLYLHVVCVETESGLVFEMLDELVQREAGAVTCV